ncbi:hypothetical protein CRG98_034692 [Punica granatum]|uniref:Uncharacterized protein n=1 Tax=Punica granatum TaxID=22663 RepID=A0A2I0IMK5_PUNGR|nr:hypothetical protein CRG98_034692 [Punica granatum]
MKVTSHGKVSSHGLADPARLKEARGRLADPARLQEARARWLGELAVLESKLAQASRPGKVARGMSEEARRTYGAGKWRKVNSHGLADPVRLQEARARWLGELAVQESKLAPTRQVCKRHDGGGSANLRRTKVSSHGLADPARWQEVRARWLGELALQESKLAPVSRPYKVARVTSEVARLTCDAGKKVSSHGLTDPARLQEARARWLGELEVEEIDSHGLAAPARLQEARAGWLGELAVQEIKLARVSRPGKIARGTSEVARRS